MTTLANTRYTENIAGSRNGLKFKLLPEPKPAQSGVRRETAALDINEYLEASNEDSFLMKVNGFSMAGAGIHPGDILLASRKTKAENGSIVIAAINGKLTVKRLKIALNKIELAPENPDYEAIEVKDGDKLEIWGVVKSVVKSL